MSIGFTLLVGGVAVAVFFLTGKESAPNQTPALSPENPTPLLSQASPPNGLSEPLDSPASPAPVGTSEEQSFFPKIFGRASVAPDRLLWGSGKNIDSPEFWEAPRASDTLLFVTAKGNDLIEVWRAPFTGGELGPLRFDRLPNGIDVDQIRDWLVVGISDDPVIEIYSLPERKLVKRIGGGAIGSGETNVDTYRTRAGEDWVYVTEDEQVKAFDLDSGGERASFRPFVGGIEEVAADSFHHIIYVPDEDGAASKRNPGGGIRAFHPDGSPYEKSGRSLFGTGGIFAADAEGITIHPCLDGEGRDTGHGFIIVADQHTQDNGFEFFNRETWEHLGTLQLTGVTNTDGIATTHQALPGFPQGAFAAVDNDRSVAIVGWDDIFSATRLTCQ